jgi:hypothetical protein
VGVPDAGSLVVGGGDDALALGIERGGQDLALMFEVNATDNYGLTALMFAAGGRATPASSSCCSKRHAPRQRRPRPAANEGDTGVVDFALT